MSPQEICKKMATSGTNPMVMLSAPEVACASALRRRAEKGGDRRIAAPKSSDSSPAMSI